MEEKKVLEVHHLSKSFLGVKALDRVELEVLSGEVHAVIGENGAGKSTMMNIILGDLPKDEGEIIFKGEKVDFKSPADAIESGISMIHQEISLVPTLTVAENIWLHRENQFMNGFLISERKRSEKTKELLNRRMKMDISPDALVSTLTVAQCQLVELARSVSCNSDVIIMDEPTSSLSDKEVVILFDIINKLRKENVAIIFITHKIEELLTISDRVSVYRDGHYIGTRDCKGTSREELVNMIIGRELTDQYPNIDYKIGDTILEIKDLNGHAYKNINFSVNKGEIVGFSGLVGAGRSEIMRGIFGIDKIDSGEIVLDGKTATIHSPQDAVALGMAMVTEDRRDFGIIKSASVKDNISVAALSQFCSRRGFVKKDTEKRAVDAMIDEMAIKVANSNMLITSLSGGNQQKAIIGRWLMTSPKLLILDEPTRGIDVGAKCEIYSIIGELAKQGMAIIVVSSEMPEILGICNRIYVVRNGEIVFECNKEEASQELLGTHALG